MEGSKRHVMPAKGGKEVKDMSCQQKETLPQHHGHHNTDTRMHPDTQRQIDKHANTHRHRHTQTDTRTRRHVHANMYVCM